MDSIKSKPTNAGGLVHTFSKVFRLRSTGIVSDDGSRKFKFQNDPSEDCVSQASAEEEKLRRREAMEALLAKLFASISAIKAAYAQLQTAQSPYDPEVIQSADETVVSELKGISELKHGYLKKQILPSQETQMLAQIQEQQNLLKTYEIMSKKLQSQLQLKSREIVVLEQKMHESEKQNKSLERRLNPRSSLSALDNIRLSALNPNHFIAVLRQTKKSIRSFVKLMVGEMESAGWDLDAAASSIEPGAVFLKPSHRFFAFESYVCRKIFADFQHPSFISDRSSRERQSRRRFFDSFTELKSFNAMEFLSRCPESAFGKFCRLKYLGLVHPKMELAFSGELSHRNLINSSKFPESPFFSAFSEMARRVWLLHSLAYSFEPEASIFQVRPGSRFSEVYMESAWDDWVGERPHVCFTVAPGFRIGKTVVQCKVYLQTGSGDAGEGR